MFRPPNEAGVPANHADVTTASHELKLIAETDDQNGLPDDVLFEILLYLNPVDLYFLSSVNKYLYEFARLDYIWTRHTHIHFPEKKFADNTYQLFFSTVKNDYKLLTNEEKIYISLIKAGDLYSIKQREKPLIVTSALLVKFDKSEISRIIRNYHIEFREYIFNNLLQNDKALTLTNKIYWSIQFDLKDQLATLLLDKSATELNEMRIEKFSLLELSIRKSLACTHLLLEKGINPNIGRYAPPLYTAAQYEDKLPIVNLLLAYHADANVLYINLFCPLYIAAQHNNINIVKALINAGADIDARNILGSTALCVAAEKGNTETVQFLLSKQANVKLRYNDGCTPLYVAALNGHLDIVKLLLPYYSQTQLDDPCADRNSALYTAAKNGHAQVCEELLKHGAKVDTIFLNGYTSLYVAAQNGHDEVVEVLLKYGANYNKPSFNATPLYTAAQNGHHKIVRVLCTMHNINLAVHFNNGYTTIHIAAQKGHLEIIQILLAAGADVNSRTNINLTPLHIAADNGHVDLVKFLLANGATHDIKTKNGWTALLIACSHSNANPYLSIIRALLQSGASLMRGDLESTLLPKVKINTIVKKVLEALMNISNSESASLVNELSFELALDFFMFIDDIASTEKFTTVDKILEIIQNQMSDEIKMHTIKQFLIQLYLQLRLDLKEQIAFFQQKNIMASAIKTYLQEKLQYSVLDQVNNQTLLPDIPEPNATKYVCNNTSF